MRVLQTFGRTESAKSGDTPSHCPLERNVDQTSEKIQKSSTCRGRGSAMCYTRNDAVPLPAKLFAATGFRNASHRWW